MGTANQTLNYANLQGSQIGRYRLENLLGIGGMGNVYKSHHPDLKRDIAVKILHPHFTQTPGFIERFRHEAAAAGSLVHPRIIQVYDFNVSDGGLYYMVMQFINGPSLEEYLALEREPLTLAQSYRLLAPVAAALHFAHEQGVIHRDIKPANILLDTRQNPFLGDFGLAKIVGVDLQTAAEIGPGTPAYMAPEQIEKGELSRATDIYGLGLVLYKMLTLRLPYEGDSLLQLIRRKTMEPARSPAEFNPHLPPQVTAIILQAIAAEPEDRFPNVLSFMEAYYQAIRDQGVTVSRYDLDTAISSGFVSLPGIYIEGYKIQREFIEPRNRPYQRYLAKNETLDELAVLTVLHNTEEENPILAGLFRERLDKLVLLDHPGIFAITRVDITADKHPFCAYAFNPGQNLATKLTGPWRQPRQAPSVPEVLLLGRQIADTLAVAARANLWHNDLQPAHIIVQKDKAPMIVGWEIPLPPPLADYQSSADEPDYIAPEQLAGDGVDGQSYQFCLGVILYECLTGQRPPMPGWRSRPYRPDDIPPARLLHQPERLVTPETQCLLGRCLASNPADRFPDMDAFIAQLDKAMAAEQQPVTVRRRSRWWAVAALLLLLCGLLLVGGIYGPGLSASLTRPETPTAAPTPTATDPISPVLVPTTTLPEATTVIGEMVAVLGPAADSQFTLEEQVTFAWHWPQPLAADEHFAVYLLGGETPILVGTVTAPEKRDEAVYQLTVQGQSILSTPATFVWQVQLITGEATASPRASSALALITFVSPSATPSRTPTATSTHTPQPGSSPTAPATMTPTQTATSQVCPRPGGWIAYQVQSGDTWGSLAALTGTPETELQQANCLPTGSRLTAGQSVWLPQAPATATTAPTTAPPPNPTATSPPVISSATPSPPLPTFTPPALPTFTPPAKP